MRFFERFTWLHVLLLSALVAALAGAVTYFGRPASYTATSSLLLSDRPDIISGMVAGSAGATSGPALDRLTVVMTSRSLRRKLVERFELADKFKLPAAEAVDALGSMSATKAMGADGLTVTVTCRGYRVPAMAWRLPLRADDAHSLCADLANAYVEELRVHLRETDLARARQTREFLETEYQQLTDDLADTEDKLEGLRTSYELVEPAAKAARLSDRIRAVEQAYTDASAEVSSTRNGLRAAEAKLDTVQVRRISSEAQSRNPVIGSLEGRRAELQIELATELARGKTEENRDVVQIRSAIEDIEEQLTEVQATVLKEMSEQVNPAWDAVAGKVVELHISLAGAEARQNRYASMLGSARTALADLPPVARMYLDITRHQDLESQQLASVAQALWRARVEEERSSSTDAFTVLDEAAPPARKRGPATLVTTLAVFLALVILQGLVIMDRRWFGG